MATEIESQAEPGTATLVGGIVSDAQRLVKQELALFRHEIKGEIRHAKVAAISLAIGAVITAVGGILLLIMAVYLLQTYTNIPLWGCYGLVGGLLAGTGAILLFFAARQAADVHLIPPPQTTESIKESFQWLKNEISSERT